MSSDITSSRFLDPAALARIKSLTLRAQKVVDGLLTGIHKSPHHGSSIEFAEHKEYSPGDEIKHIDWKAVGRLDKYYVKKFEQESNLRAYFVVDTSGSMGYGPPAGQGLSKFEYSSVVAVSLAYLLLRQQDAVGLVTFADQGPKTLPPRARTTHLSHMCSVLEGVTPEGGTSLHNGLQGLTEISRRRGLIFVFSDFFTELDRGFKLLRQLVSRGHMVTVYHTLDRDELTFPFEKMTIFEGMESRSRLLVEPRLIRDRYLERLQAHREEVRNLCLRARMGYVPVDTGESPEKMLLRALTAPPGTAQQVA